MTAPMSDSTRRDAGPPQVSEYDRVLVFRVLDAVIAISKVETEDGRRLVSKAETVDKILRLLEDEDANRPHEIARHAAEAPALPVIPRSAVLSSQRYAAVTANSDDGHTQEAELFYGRDSATEYAAEYGGMVFDCVLIDARAVAIEPEPAPQEKPE